MKKMGSKAELPRWNLCVDVAAQAKEEFGVMSSQSLGQNSAWLFAPDDFERLLGHKHFAELSDGKEVLEHFRKVHAGFLAAAPVGTKSKRRAAMKGEAGILLWRAAMKGPKMEPTRP